MKKTVNRPARRWASLLVLPAIAVFLWAFAKPAYSISYVNQEDTFFLNDTIKPSPLYIIDGKEQDSQTLNEMDPKNIKSIEVWKDTTAIEKYGEKGKNGVIEITTKTVEKNQPLYILDGKEIDSRILNNMNPNTIESIDVLKDKSATDLYGKKGKNGVVIITSKNG